MTMFPVLFAIPRTSGWMAQWAEMVRDPEQKIARPRQLYVGEETRLGRRSRSAPSRRRERTRSPSRSDGDVRLRYAAETWAE